MNVILYGHCLYFYEKHKDWEPITKIKEKKMDLSKLNSDYVWMEVSNDGEFWLKRAVIRMCGDKYVVISDAKNETHPNLLDFKNGYHTTKIYKYAREYKEPKYKPYPEMTDELARELLGKRVRTKEKLSDGNYRYYIINEVDSNIKIGLSWRDLENVFESYVFEDGTPFGVKED